MHVVAVSDPAVGILKLITVRSADIHPHQLSLLVALGFYGHLTALACLLLGAAGQNAAAQERVRRRHVRKLQILRRSPRRLLAGLGNVCQRQPPVGPGAAVFGAVVEQPLRIGIAGGPKPGKHPALRRQHRPRQHQHQAGCQQHRPGDPAPLPCGKLGQSPGQIFVKVLGHRGLLLPGHMPQTGIQIVHVRSSFRVTCGSDSASRSLSRARLSRDFTVPAGTRSSDAMSATGMSS